MRKLKQIVLFILLAAVLGAGSYGYWLQGRAADLEEKNQDQAEKLASAQQRLTAEDKELAAARDQLAASKQQCSNGDAALKANIDAFAKQAASCERVKRSLHYQES